MVIRAPGIIYAFKAETRVQLTVLAMSVYFLQKRIILLEAPQQSFFYVSLAISVLLSYSHLEFHGRLSVYLNFQASVIDAGKEERDWEYMLGYSAHGVCHINLSFDQ